LEHFGTEPEDEEIPCVECEGNGDFETRVALEIALEPILKRITKVERSARDIWDLHP
jgi:hypothetical protein